jgi:hypothetical protein
MRRVLVVAVLLLATPALAASVHFKQQKEPSFVDGGLVLSAAGAIAGLGGGDVVISLTAQALTVSTCTNQGGNQAPGQNPAPTTVAGSVPIPASEIKNGNLAFSVTVEPPTTPIPGAPGCPNPNWTESIDDLAFTSATVSVEQPPGTVVLTTTCTIAPPSVDGPVPANTVSCPGLRN